MYRYALRSLLARRWRTVLSALAVLVGVAMISGAFVFTDTIRAALRDLVSSQVQGAQVVVTSPQGLYSATNPPANIPASLATQIANLPGVTAVQGQISDVATVVGRNGRVVKKAGFPTVAVSYLPAPFAGVQLVKGTAPRPLEVVLDQSTAARAHYRVGDLVPIVTRPAGAPIPAVGDRPPGERLDRRRDVRGVRPGDRADLVRQAGSAQRDLRSRWPRHAACRGRSTRYCRPA